MQDKEVQLTLLTGLEANYPAKKGKKTKAPKRKCLISAGNISIDACLDIDIKNNEEIIACRAGLSTASKDSAEEAQNPTECERGGISEGVPPSKLLCS